MDGSKSESRNPGGVRPLVADYLLEFTYKRSLGPVIGNFFSGLREQLIYGARTPSGRVIVPPTEYDPDTGEAVVEHVLVGDAGRVETWSWVAAPLACHPLPHPFAWALIRLDGADTSLFHAVDIGARESMKTGMRVKARWRAERIGTIRDLECFVPEWFR